MRSRLEAPVLVGVGAAFDFHAGLKRQAPQSLQRLGLEWAFRLAQEPRRLFRRYLVTNVAFLGLTLRYLGRRRRP
jgi:N-acetylglucosaminyldiphosphoundecaprenol N-acetyl-beta-D-mannosaminyltransferase